jgi:YHS domain-containing protein
MRSETFMNRSVLTLAGLLLFVQLGCDPSDPQPTAPAAPTTSASADGPVAGSVQVAECVVCVGHQITVKPTTPRSDYDGTTYYFCSEGCKTKFLKAPADHVHPSAPKTVQSIGTH